MIDYHYHLSSRCLEKDKEILKENIKKYSLKTIITLATYFPNKNSGLSNYRLLKAIEDVPEAYMLASLDFSSYIYMFLNELSDLQKEEKVLGLKIYTGYQDIDFESEIYKNVISLFSEDIIMFHAGFCHKEGKSFNPIELEKTFIDFPDTKFIIAHMGNPYFKEVSYLINRYENVFTDMSGLMDKEEDIPRAIECIDYVFENGDNKKILFGTDFPIQNYEDSLFLLKDRDVFQNRIGIKGI